MKSSSILTAKSLVLSGILVFSTASAVHAQGYSDKDDSMQKPGEYTQQPGTSGGSDYGTSGTDQRNQYDRPRDSGKDQYGQSYQGYTRDVGDDMYDWSSTDGTGPKIKGRY
jgi:hypothetical protein